jgi:hypothetical protein
MAVGINCARIFEVVDVFFVCHFRCLDSILDFVTWQKLSIPG